ncbi:MAG: hypothetical protein ABJO28_12445 [Maribacter dokdonensis]|uniref:cupredoxin domain-containing protein n=1 Tax=Maribacter dokdonensis TaxID=320912 RepID=UPI00329739CE
MKKIISALIIICALFMNQNLKAQAMEKNVTIIELTQTEGQFETQNLELTAGKYKFRVVNKDVDKDLGLAIQKKEDKGKDLMKTAIPTAFTSAFVKKGKAEYSGVVELKKGKYVYFCPLNPTPYYNLTVK